MDIYTGRYLTVDDEGTLTLRVATILDDGTEADAEFRRLGPITRVNPPRLESLSGVDLSEELEAAEEAWDRYRWEGGRPFAAGPFLVRAREAVTA